MDNPGGRGETQFYPVLFLPGVDEPELPREKNSPTFQEGHAIKGLRTMGCKIIIPAILKTYGNRIIPDIVDSAVNRYPVIVNLNKSIARKRPFFTFFPGRPDRFGQPYTESSCGGCQDVWDNFDLGVIYRNGNGF